MQRVVVGVAMGFLPLGGARAALPPVVPPPPALVGAPVPFPDDLPPEFGPDRFGGEVRAALAECGLPPEAVGLVECSEFPCTVWLDLAQVPGGPAACAPWVRRLGEPEGMPGALLAPTGLREFVMVVGKPPDPDHDDLGPRYEARVERGQDQLAAVWGARRLDRRAALEYAIRVAARSPSTARLLPALRRELLALPPEE